MKTPQSTSTLPLKSTCNWICLSFLSIVLNLSCQRQSDEKQNEPLALPSGGCATTWADSTAMDFVNQLELATKTGHSVWNGYKLGDGAVVLHAGKSADSTECLGLWKSGKVISYTETSEGPKLSTPLYGYYLNFENPKEGYENPLTEISQQPADIRQWLEGYNVRSAVLMPVNFPKFPFKIPALVKTQIAIHEAFHVEVMIRHWYTGRGAWPAWDHQPDRKGLQSCYNTNEEVKLALQEERAKLSNLIEALLDGDKSASCLAGNEFLTQRALRYELLKDVTVNRQDETQCDCQEAENIMELEEGLADYASWTMLYNIGLSSREALLRRYRAIQNEPFYLSGAMLMHAVSLMNNGEVSDIINDIANSSGQDVGAPFPVFEKEFARYCSEE